MMRKLMSTLTISLMIIILSFSGFAMDSSIDWDKSIEIISPEIDSSSNVVLNDGELLINIRLNGNVSTSMSMYNVGETLEVEDMYLEEHNSLLKFISEYPKNTELSEEAISNIEVLDEEELIDLYSQMEEEVSILSNDIQSMYMIIDFIMLKDRENYTETDIESLEKFDYMLVEFFEKKLEYEFVAKSYNEIIKEVVFEAEEIKLEGFLPYFQMEIEGVESGNYQLVFRDTEGNDVKSRFFTLISNDVVEDELIGEEGILK